jgi:FlaA1/EpsC-like NDP-sugar epimerase
VLSASFVLAYWIRFDFHPPESEIRNCLSLLPWVVALQWLTLVVAGAYCQIWRFLSLWDLNAFAASAAASFSVLLVFRLTGGPALTVGSMPLSVIGICTLLAYTSVIGVRVIRRVYFERFQERRGERRISKKPVLFIGADRHGLSAAGEIARLGSSDVEIKGFVDDEREKENAQIQGFRVLGSTDDLPALVREHSIDHVVIALDKASREEIRRIVRICERVPVRARILPTLHETLQTRAEALRIRDLKIEDLLGRETVQLDEEPAHVFFQSKVVLISGAGGSIGSELVRQCLRYEPRQIVLVERTEYALFQIHRELQDSPTSAEIVPVLADTRDAARMRLIMRKYRPHAVVHAAAHKHVPLAELNVSEAYLNNAESTRTLGMAAGEAGVECFVLISTDKAVRPTSVMGATKRIAELIIQDLDWRYETRFLAVRFGNVIGSTGSVIPIFQEQIAGGGPVTVTHPGMTRYFMTIPEASQLVLQTATIGRGGEIFVLDMGEPVRILDLAEDMIRLAGLKPYDDVDIAFTGMRPGEKLFETLYAQTEPLTRTRDPKIFIGNIATPDASVPDAVTRILRLCERQDDAGVRAEIARLLPEARLNGEKEGELETMHAAV